MHTLSMYSWRLTVNGPSLGVKDHADPLSHAGRKPPEELRLQLTPALLGARGQADLTVGLIWTSGWLVRSNSAFANDNPASVWSS